MSRTDWREKVIDDPAMWRQDLDRWLGCTLVLTNGCFDLIHMGHIEFLQAAREQTGGVRLIVAVNSDESVRQLKGPTRPLVPEYQRLAVVAALEAVDRCLIFREKRCDQLIRILRPNVWAKGGDYTLKSLDPSERAAAKEVGARIQIIPYTHGISTTLICQAAAAHP